MLTTAEINELINAEYTALCDHHINANNRNDSLILRDFSVFSRANTLQKIYGLVDEKLKEIQANRDEPSHYFEEERAHDELIMFVILARVLTKVKAREAAQVAHDVAIKERVTTENNDGCNTQMTENKAYKKPRRKKRSTAPVKKRKYVHKSDRKKATRKKKARR